MQMGAHTEGEVDIDTTTNVIFYDTISKVVLCGTVLESIAVTIL